MHGELAFALVGLGEAELRRGRLDEAARTLDRALAVLEPDPTTARWVGEIRFAQARVAAARGDRHATRVHAEQAMDADAHADPRSLRARDEVLAWMRKRGG